MESENNYTETDLGNVSPNPRGEYNSETTYEYLDLVNYQGGSYICTVEPGKTITGTTPVSGKDTENWQLLTLPGDLTPDYVAMHDNVVQKAKQVEASRVAVELSQTEIEAAQADVQQMRQDTQEAAQAAQDSKESASGYAQSAEVSRQAAQSAEQNATMQVKGFDDHVTAKKEEAEQEITAARQTAVNAVTAQGEKTAKELENIKSNASDYARYAQKYASDASTAASAAETFARDASTAKAGAEKAASEAATTLENTKNVKKEVDTTAAEVNSKAEETLTEMNTAKTNYDAAAEKAQKDLTTAKDSAVKAVSDTGTEQVNKVTQTGTEKVTEVTSEGTKQVGLVRDAAEPFLTDTENLKRNADRVNAMIGLLSLTDKVYSVDIPLWETTQAGNCIKSDDNAGLVAYPSTATEHRQNDYEDLPWFKTIDVNAIVDDDGIKRITAIKGDDNYSETGDADVFVCGMAYYEKWSDLGNGYMRYSRCFTPREGYELNKMAYNADGSTNPFFLIAKYPLTKGDDGKMHSQPNRRPAYYTQLTGSENISTNDSINHMKKRGKYYSLGTYFDNGYIQTTWYLMFGDINSDKTMNGCTGGHNFQYVASIESDELNTYFPVTNSQANSIEVGSHVSVGHEYVNGTSRANDRYTKQVHEIAMDVKVLKKEAIDDNNTAIYLDCDPFATTHQTSGDLELRCIMSSMHWWTGFSKDVKGRTGCPCPTTTGLTNRKYPIVFNGIEMQLGFYEVMAGFDLITDDNGTQDIYALTDATKATTSPKAGQAGYIKISSIIPARKNAWNHITHFTFVNGYFCATSCGESGSGESKGCGDAVFISSGNTGETRALPSFGNLWDGGACGVLFLSLNNWLGGFGWHIGGRLSVNAVLQDG